MITIKSYTDFSQSKKLAEILPLESADMVWSSVFYEGAPSNGDEKLINAYLDPKTNHFYFAELYEDFFYDRNNIKEYPDIPCWSLASLLNILPEIRGNKPIIDLNDNYITYVHGSSLHIDADNLLDSCYEMIIKLHKLNLL